MRITYFEQKMIVKTFHQFFGDGEIYLFGSRVDDNGKGGDIDLYLIPLKRFDDEQKRKIDFLIKLEKHIGEQKIDVILAVDENRLIEKIALRDGIKLKISTIRIEKYLNECDKHVKRIIESFDEVQSQFPLSAKKYVELSNYDVKNIDQYLFRFAKLQDTIGDKLFKAVIGNYVESVDELTFIDILNKLEKIKIIDNAEEWSILRKIRNDISHHYDDEPHEMAEALNSIFAQKEVLIGIYQKIKEHFQNNTNL